MLSWEPCMCLFMNYFTRVNWGFLKFFCRGMGSDTIENYTIQMLSMNSGFRFPLRGTEIIHFIFLQYIILHESQRPSKNTNNFLYQLTALIFLNVFTLKHTNTLYILFVDNVFRVSDDANMLFGGFFFQLNRVKCCINK